MNFAVFGMVFFILGKTEESFQLTRSIFTFHYRTSQSGQALLAKGSLNAILEIFERFT